MVNAVRDETRLLPALHPGAVSAVSGRGWSPGWRTRGSSAGLSLTIIQCRRKVGWYVESKTGIEVFPHMKKNMSACEQKKRTRERHPAGAGSRTVEQKHTVGQIRAEGQRLTRDALIDQCL